MRAIQILKIASSLPAALAIVVLLVFGVGEIIAGDWSGFSHIIPALVFGLLLWLGWKQPLWSGVGFVLVAALSAFFFRGTLQRSIEWLAPFLIFIFPQVLSGILLLVAAWLQYRQK